MPMLPITSCALWGKRVADYYAKFDMIVLSLPESHPKGLIHALIYRLKPNLWPLVKAQVAQKEEPILPKAITVAT